MYKKFYKWIKIPPTTETMVETTKDYFSEDDEYINAKNGWQMLPEEYIKIKIKDKDEKNR